MPRTFTNLVVGRKRILGPDDTSLEHALGILKRAGDGKARGSICYQQGSGIFVQPIFNKKNIPTADMVGFIEEHFGHDRNHYHDIFYAIYAGKRDERHYLDFSRGDVLGRLGPQLVTQQPPHTYAWIDFVVPRQEVGEPVTLSQPIVRSTVLHPGIKRALDM